MLKNVAPSIVVFATVQRIDYALIRATVKHHIPRTNMANSRRKNQETRVSEDVRSKASDTATKPFQDGDVRAAILELIGTDEDVMKSIVDSVSQVIVTKLLSDSFIAKLADGLMKDGVLDAIKQNVYDDCALDDEKISSTVESLERRVGDLDNDNRALREELDAMEQYSRRIIVSLCMASLRQRKTPETPYCMFSTANSTCPSRLTASTAVIA